MILDMIKNDLIDKIDYSQFSFLENKKSVIVCGNGTNGYYNDSKNFIDDHDLVVRMNHYVPNEFVGYKSDVLFIGASAYQHLQSDEYYPFINNFNIYISTPYVFDRIKKHKVFDTNNKIIVFYPRDIMVKILKKYGYKKDFHITGVHSIILFYTISQKYSIPKFNIIGFNKNHYGAKNTIEYYYGIRKNDCHKHHRHDWLFQDKILDCFT